MLTHFPSRKLALVLTLVSALSVMLLFLPSPVLNFTRARSPQAPAVQLTRWRAFAVHADDGTNYGVIGTLQNQRFDFQTTFPAFGFNLYLPARNFTAVLKYLGTPSFELLCALVPALALPVVAGYACTINLDVHGNGYVCTCDLAHRAASARKPPLARLCYECCCVRHETGLRCARIHQAVHISVFGIML